MRTDADVLKEIQEDIKRRSETFAVGGFQVQCIWCGERGETLYERWEDITHDDTCYYLRLNNLLDELIAEASLWTEKM